MTDTRTTLKLFSKYIETSPEGKIDPSGILSKACYGEWLSSRKKLPKNPPHAFRKAITGHCRGDKGLQPFSKEIEEAVLKMLRKKSIWSCFEGSKHNIGLRGYQTLGHWERKRKISVISEPKESRPIEQQHKRQILPSLNHFHNLGQTSTFGSLFPMPTGSMNFNTCQPVDLMIQIEINRLTQQNAIEQMRRLKMSMSSK